MKLENLKKINALNSELNTNKNKLKIIEDECIKLDYMWLTYKNSEQIFLNDDEFLANVRALALVCILKRIKKIKEQLKELGVEVDE